MCQFTLTEISQQQQDGLQWNFYRHSRPPEDKSHWCWRSSHVFYSATMWLASGFEKNVSTTFGWIATKFGTHIHAPPRLNFTNFDDPLAFNWAPPIRSTFVSVPTCITSTWEKLALRPYWQKALSVWNLVKEKIQRFLYKCSELMVNEASWSNTFLSACWLSSRAKSVVLLAPVMSQWCHWS